MSSGAVALGAAATAAAAALIWWSAFRDTRENPDLPQPPPQQQPSGGAGGNSSEQGVTPAVGNFTPRAAKPPVDPPLPVQQTLLLPDGTRVQSLNGAVNATPLADAWPKNVPWSPIVRIERSDVGVDWYVHEDGSRSTTEMKWRSDLGREDAVTRLARPAPTLPVLPSSNGQATRNRSPK